MIYSTAPPKSQSKKLYLMQLHARFKAVSVFCVIYLSFIFKERAYVKRNYFTKL